MKRPRQIPRPDMTGCVRLTPAQANEIRFGNSHSVITPDRLASTASSPKPQ